MHPLVHAWAKDRLAADVQTTEWATAASILSLSREDFDYQDFFTKIQSHIEFSIGHDPQRLFANSMYTSLEICRILYSFTWVLYRLRNDRLAEIIAELLGSRIGHEISPQSKNWRAVLFLQAVCKHHVAKYSEEMALLEKVILYDKSNLTPEDPISLQARDMLGRAYRALGKYPEAIGLLEDVLQIRQELLAPTHPERLASQHELGVAYLENDQVGKAIELFEKVVQIRENTLAPTHPSRLASQHELGRAYLENSQVKKAIELFEKVVQIREKTPVPTHPDRLVSQHNLASAYYENGQYQKALSIIQEVVRIRSQHLDPGNSYRIQSENLLSDCLSVLGQDLLDTGSSSDTNGGRSAATTRNQQASGTANLEVAISDLQLSTSAVAGESHSRKRTKRSNLRSKFGGRRSRRVN